MILDTEKEINWDSFMDSRCIYLAFLVMLRNQGNIDVNKDPLGISNIVNITS